MRTIHVILCFALLATGCSKNDCKIEAETANIPMDVKITRLEQKLFGLKSKEEVVEFMNDHAAFSESFLQRSQYPNDEALADRLYKLINDPHIDTLYRETMEAFGDISELEEEFRSAFRQIKSNYPDFNPPEIYTVVTGLGNDLYVSDSLVVIGLDYFIGEGATYRPIDMPQYILKRYQKEYIVPSVVLLMSDKYNKTNYQNKTMLADMIYYGKAYYFTKEAMPCTPDSLLIGYTGQELVDVDEYEEVIWANFIQNELLYETSHAMKNKFLGERPKVYEIGNKCPGRIGAWVGWEIVNSYMDRNGKTLPELMRDDDAQKIFEASRYRPD